MSSAVLPATVRQPTPQARPAAQVFMFNPVVDLAVIAGGLTFVLFPISLLFASQLNIAAFLVLLFFCNYPHYMATLHRVYRDRSQIERYKFFSIYVTGLLVLTAALGHLMAGRWLTLLYSVYFTWSPFHYTGQNYGISLMYLRRGGTQPSNAERWLLYVAFIACFLMYVTAINTDLGIAPLFPFHSLGIPRQVGRVAYLSLLVIGVVSAAGFLWRIVPRTPGRALLPVLLLSGSQFAWFAAATGMPLFSAELGLQWLPIEALFPTIAFLHCAQYLGVTAYYAKREQTTAAAARFSVVRYLAVLIVGGVFLWIGSTRLLSQVFGLDYGISFLLMLSLINIHHFVMDGAIWKLRDGRLARLLLSAEKPASAPGGAAPVGARPAAAPLKRRGRSATAVDVAERPRIPSASAWRTPAWVAAAAVALALAGSDIYYRFGIWKAGQVSRTGDVRGAVNLYSSVWGINDRSAEALDGLAFWSLKTGQVQQAADRWEQSLKLNPTETSVYAHIGLGEAYLRMGRVSDAMEHLEKAIRYRPNEPSSYILMAMAYDQQGNAAKAQEMRRRASEVSPSGPVEKRLFY
jgi:tetratricopeptide (TPR) repeat protein